jgi:hypothetical protein
VFGSHSFAKRFVKDIGSGREAALLKEPLLEPVLEEPEPSQTGSKCWVVDPPLPGKVVWRFLRRCNDRSRGEFGVVVDLEIYEVLEALGLIWAIVWLFFDCNLAHLMAYKYLYW